jgi:hypothetical protein
MQASDFAILIVITENSAPTDVTESIFSTKTTAKVVAPADSVDEAAAGSHGQFGGAH